MKKSIKKTVKIDETDLKRSEIISEELGLNKFNFSKVVRFLINNYSKPAPFKSMTQLIIEEEDKKVLSELPTEDFSQENIINSNVEVQKSLKDIMNVILNYDINLDISGFPKEMIYNEAYLAKKALTKMLNKNLSEEFTMLKYLIKEKKSHERIESGKPEQEDLGKDRYRYNRLKSEVLSNRMNIIFPLIACINRLDIIMKDSYDDKSENLEDNLQSIRYNPFKEIVENIDDFLLDIIVDYDPEYMFQDLIKKEPYLEHIKHITSISN